MAVGAELSTLSALHRTFQDKAQAAVDIKTSVNSSVLGADWTGRYADDFRASWEEYSANLDRLQEALDQAANDVRINHNNIAEATGEGERI